MSDEYSGPGDTGGGTAVLDAPPASPSSGSDSSAAAGPISSTGSEGADESGSPARDPIPYERFAEVNERYNRLKWAEAYGDPDDVQRRVALTNWIANDPRGFREYFESQLRAHGYLENAQQPAMQRQPQNDELPGPDYQYTDERGQTQQFYSAPQMQRALAWLEQRTSARLAPVEQFLGAQQVQMRAAQDAQRILADAATWPYFEDYQQDIHAAMSQDRRLSLEGAYRRVVLPQIRERERQVLLGELQQKPDANTTSPTRSQPQGGEDLQKLSLQTLFAREMKKRGMGR